MTIENSIEEPGKKKKQRPSGRQKIIITLILIAIGAIVMLAGETQAWNPPTTGDPGYGAYDLFVNDLLGGGIGFVLAMWLTINGGMMLGQNFKMAALQIIGAAAILKGEELMISLGWLIS